MSAAAVVAAAAVAVVVVAGAEVAGARLPQPITPERVAAAFKQAGETIRISRESGTTINPRGVHLPLKTLYPLGVRRWQYNVFLYASSAQARAVLQRSTSRDPLTGTPVRYLRYRNVIVMYRAQSPRAERIKVAMAALAQR